MLEKCVLSFVTYQYILFNKRIIYVLQGLPSDIDSEVEMVRTSLKNGADKGGG